MAQGSIGFDFGCPNRYFRCYFMMCFFHQKVSKIAMDVFCSKSNTTLCQIDYFSQKKLKFQMTNSGQNEKIDVSKSFIFRIYNMLYLRAASKSIHRLKTSYKIDRITFHCFLRAPLHLGITCTYCLVRTINKGLVKLHKLMGTL